MEMEIEQQTAYFKFEKVDIEYLGRLVDRSSMWFKWSTQKKMSCQTQQEFCEFCEYSV
jgi:hypothetical protein